MFATILMDVYETLMLIISDDVKQKKLMYFDLYLALRGKCLYSDTKTFNIIWIY